MKRLALAILLAWVPGILLASSEGPELEHADIDLANKQSLQRGARLFSNYCLSCHGASYARYNRVAKDIGITDDMAEKYLINTGDKATDLMKVAIRKSDAKNWFGNPPPDLTLVARRRGPDWVYTYLKSFYLDDSRPFGVNNTVFPNVGMPHVLWELQGWQEPVYAEGHEGGEKVIEKLELAQPGSMTEADYDKAIRDLTAFMTYLAEPVKLERQHLGIWVLLFLAVLFVFAYLLKKEYWKDVH